MIRYFGSISLECKIIENICGTLTYMITNRSKYFEMKCVIEGQEYYVTVDSIQRAAITRREKKRTETRITLSGLSALIAKPFHQTRLSIRN